MNHLYIKEIKETTYRSYIYILSNGLKLKSMQAVADYVGLSSHTIWARKQKFPHDSPAILYSEPLSEEVLETLGVDPGTFSKDPRKLKSNKSWDRTKCRRDEEICKNYGQCQSSRLGLEGFPELVAPVDTESCFVPEHIVMHRYQGALSGCRMGFTI